MAKQSKDLTVPSSQTTSVNSLVVSIKKLSSEAQLPTREARDIPDAGWDIYSMETVRIPGSGKLAVKTGIALAIPIGWYGNIRNRSGNAVKTPLMVDAGIIDPGYRGEIKVVLVNHSEYPYDVNKGDKIAQILFGKIPETKFEEVKELPSSDRGEKGFGSSDLNV
jgi:dUTP pyrophosphatase